MVNYEYNNILRWIFVGTLILGVFIIASILILSNINITIDWLSKLKHG
jgi:hypothetical protein